MMIIRSALIQENKELENKNLKNNTHQTIFFLNLACTFCKTVIWLLKKLL